MQGRALPVVVVGTFLTLCAGVLYLAARPKSPSGGTSSTASSSSVTASAAPSASAAPGVEIMVSSSDGKKEWLEAVTKDFHGTVSGKPIRVRLQHVKSGESLMKILAGEEKPVVWSPASNSWIERLNSTWGSRHGHAFVTQPRPTVKSPLIVATWEPMARALGWPDKAIGWDDLFKVASDPQGWASLQHPEWGPFRFGHAHPDFSTSAMLSVISSIYAAAGKTSGLTADDIKNPAVVRKVGAVERAIVHYGESSSWLTEKLCTKGPAYLSAVTLYESNVVMANDKYKAQLSSKLVSIYPKEGTFWEDHPIGVVDADWVSADQKAAGQAFVDYVAAKEQQARAVQFGYRPTDAGIPLGAPIDEAHGADPKQTDSRKLEYVPEELFQRANELWHQVKKPSTVYLVLDTSGSMQGAAMNAAKKGAAAFIRTMEKNDEVAFIAFSTKAHLLQPASAVRDVGEQLATKVEGLFASGQTALYDAVSMAMQAIETRKKTDTARLYGIVVLSDGADTSSTKTLSDLTDLLPSTEGAEGTRIFTVAYGDEAAKDVLRKLANQSNARYLEGNADNIKKIYHQISAYF